MLIFHFFFTFSIIFFAFGANGIFVFQKFELVQQKLMEEHLIGFFAINGNVNILN